MRRLAFSLIASCGVAVLSACSGGFGFSGVGSNNQTPDTIVFQNGSASVNDFFVSPTGNSPVEISAVAVKGSGLGAIVIPDQGFTWAASYAPAGTTYLRGASPNGSGTCGTPASTPPINSLLQLGGTGAAFPLYGTTYTQLGGTPSGPPLTGTLMYTQSASTIFVGPPTTPLASGTPASATTTVVGGANYCLNVVAKHVASGRIGSTLVVVATSP